MTSITLHDLDDRVAAELRARAAEHGRSVEQEACAVLTDALGVEGGDEGEPLPEKLGTAIHELFKPFGIKELPIPPREPAREPPTFD
ncbi:MAG: plasmid stabilization protein [Chloroflexi bacterium]|nr:plasmid stabilization protein [Chloroflexota bacterium]MYD66730.1 plasmid stabilization protein [Chloroflexota bacterium]